jgi:hypothetical protein
MLAFLEGDRPEELTHEPITAASLISVRRPHPGVRLDVARAPITGYSADPATLAFNRCHVARPDGVATHRMTKGFGCERRPGADAPRLRPGTRSASFFDRV